MNVRNLLIYFTSFTSRFKSSSLPLISCLCHFNSWWLIFLFEWFLIVEFNQRDSLTIFFYFQVSRKSNIEIYVKWNLSEISKKILHHKKIKARKLSQPQLWKSFYQLYLRKRIGLDDVTLIYFTSLFVNPQRWLVETRQVSRETRSSSSV